MNKITRLRVEGMTCGGCVSSVTRVLKQIPGVTDAQVVLEPGLATVTFDDRTADVAALVAAVERAGFVATPSQD